MPKLDPVKVANIAGAILTIAETGATTISAIVALLHGGLSDADIHAINKQVAADAQAHAEQARIDAGG